MTPAKIWNLGKGGNSMYENTIGRLGNSDPNEILFSEDARNLSLNCTFAGLVGGEGHDVVVRLNGITDLNLKRADDDRSRYFVGDASLDRVENEGAPAKGDLYRFQLNGGLTLDVCCETVQVLEQLPISKTVRRELSATK